MKINVIGQLGGNEILAVMSSGSLNAWRKLYRSVPDMKRVNIGYLIFLASQILSDLINHSSTENMMRGCANIVFAIIVTNFLARVIYRDQSAVIYYFIGSILSMMIWKVTDVEDIGLDTMSVFKFTLVPMMNSAILILTWIILKKKILSNTSVSFLLLFFGVFCIAFDARSNGMMFVILSLLFSFKSKIPKVTVKNFTIILLFFGLGFQILFSIYVSQVLSGQIGGEHSKRQLEMVEDPYNPLNLLMAGRSEVYVATIAIRDKPFFGHGSWAPDPLGKYTLMLLKLHNKEESFDAKSSIANGKFIIPSHSIVFGSWMTAGVGALFGMLYIFVIFFKRAMGLINSRNVQEGPFMIIVLYYIITFAWTFLFSPLPHIKHTLPIIIAFIIVSYRIEKLNEEYYDLVEEAENEEEVSISRY